MRPPELPTLLGLLMSLTIVLTLCRPTLAISTCTLHVHCAGPSDADSTSLCTAGVCLPFPGVRARAFYDPSAPALNLSAIIGSVNAVPFPVAQRVAVTRYLGTLLASFYPHVFTARSIHGVAVPGAFDALADSLPGSGQTHFEFHLALRALFARLNDFHTIYQPPPPIRYTVAALGFTVARFYTPKPLGRHLRFTVVDVLPSITAANPAFKRGVTVLSVDGVGASMMALRLGRAMSAANSAAKMTRGTLALTTRSLALGPLPVKQVAHIRFKTAKGKKLSIRLPWRYTTLTDPSLLYILSRRLVVHVSGQHDIASAPSLLTNSLPNLKVHNAAAAAVAGVTAIPVPPPFNQLFSAYVRVTAKGPVAVLRFPNFGVDASLPLAAVLTSVLSSLPPTVRGLVIDIRDNVGGFASPCKLVTELISNVTVPSSPSQLRVSQQGARVIAAAQRNSPNGVNRGLAPFAPAYASALMAGESFTGPVGNIFSRNVFKGDVTAAAAVLPRVPRAFFGPVVTLIDAATYSAGDVFAALQADTAASLLVGVDASTGGGGASVTSFLEMREAFPTVLTQPLPEGMSFQMAVARFFRTGPKSGAFIEAFGVKPDVRYFPTRKDALNADADMFEFLAKKLATMN